MIKQGQLAAQVIYDAMPLFRRELFKQNETGNQMRLCINGEPKAGRAFGAPHDGGEVSTYERVTAGISHGSPDALEDFIPGDGERWQLNEIV